jgi:hypothetical protein
MRTTVYLILFWVLTTTVPFHLKAQLPPGMASLCSCLRQRSPEPGDTG